MEAVGPVVVDDGPVVRPDGEKEGDQSAIVVSLNSEQVSEHEQSLPHLLHITQPGGVVGESKRIFGCDWVVGGMQRNTETSRG